jgi:hypothetical protein
MVPTLAAGDADRAIVHGSALSSLLGLDSERALAIVAITVDAREDDLPPALWSGVQIGRS